MYTLLSIYISRPLWYLSAPLRYLTYIFVTLGRLYASHLAVRRFNVLFSKDCAAVILMSAESATKVALDALQILGMFPIVYYFYIYAKNMVIHSSMSKRLPNCGYGF